VFIPVVLQAVALAPAETFTGALAAPLAP